ncbi:GSCOCG00005944001-RA-CDS [Cotesia congregata]|nr:GSCOCG00005944001-RA-CDS [Cotesia congregata]
MVTPRPTAVPWTPATIGLLKVARLLIKSLTPFASFCACTPSRLDFLLIAPALVRPEFSLANAVTASARQADRASSCSVGSSLMSSSSLAKQTLDLTSFFFPAAPFLVLLNSSSLIFFTFFRIRHKFLLIFLRKTSLLTRGLPEALEKELEECLRMIIDSCAVFRIFAGNINSVGDAIEDRGDFES